MSLILVNAKEVEAICQGNGELKVNKLFLEFEDIACIKSVKANVRKQTSKCGERGTLLTIGYSFEESGEHLPLIKVCYYAAKGVTLYTEHLLHGAEIKCE